MRIVTELAVITLVGTMAACSSNRDINHATLPDSMLAVRIAMDTLAGHLPPGIPVRVATFARTEHGLTIKILINADSFAAAGIVVSGTGGKVILDPQLRVVDVEKYY